MAKSEQVPPHLEHIRKSAIIIYTTLEEERNASIKEDKSEESPEAGNVLTADRPVNTDGIGRSEICDSPAIPERAVAEEPRPSGRNQHFRPTLDADWSVSFTQVR